MIFKDFKNLDAVGSGDIFLFNALFKGHGCSSSNNRLIIFEAANFYFNENPTDEVNNISFVKNTFDVVPFQRIEEENVIVVNVQLKLNHKFDEGLKNKNSTKFLKLSTAIIISLTQIYEKIPGFIKVVIIKFTPGSIITDYEVILDNQINKGSDTTVKAEVDIVNQRELNKPDATVGNIPIVSGSIKVGTVTNPKSQEASSSSSLATWIIVLIASCCIILFLVIVIVHQRVKYTLNLVEVLKVLALKIFFSLNFNLSNKLFKKIKHQIMVYQVRFYNKF